MLMHWATLCTCPAARPTGKWWLRLGQVGLGVLRHRRCAGTRCAGELDSFCSQITSLCLAEILNKDGTINRKILGAKVFGNQVRAAQGMSIFNLMSRELCAGALISSPLS